MKIILKEGGKTMGMFFLLVIFVLSPVVAFGEEKAVEKQIAEALLPLPDSLRGGATVVVDSTPGNRTVLRNGTNAVICHADTPAPGFAIRCHHKDMDAFFTRTEQLLAEGKSEADLRDTLSAEIKAGKLKVAAGSAEYVLSGPFFEGALPIMAVFLPNATAESTGLSTEPSGYRPWLMWAGTPMAHVMLPGK
jgi:hypothetical protein